jgi:hypothetical protein
VGSLKRFSTTTLALCTLISTAASAQQAQPDEIKQRIANRDHKLLSAFLRTPGASWTTNYEEARRSADCSGKLILGYFTRSYAPCGPCMQLEQTVFAKQDFVEFSKNVVLFCHISTRIPGEANETLFAEKGGNAFPTLMVLDQDGNVLARQCGERSLRVVRDVVTEGHAFANTIRRCTPRVVRVGYTPHVGVWGITECSATAEERYECLVKQIQYGHFAPDVARARVRELDNLSADRKGWFEAQIVSRECSQCMLEIRKAADVAGQYRAARALVLMKKAGHIPSDSNVFPFWEWVMAVAKEDRDIALFEDGLIAIKAILPDDATRREKLQENENMLESMKREIRLGSSGVISR